MMYAGSFPDDMSQIMRAMRRITALTSSQPMRPSSARPSSVTNAEYVMNPPHRGEHGEEDPAHPPRKEDFHLFRHGVLAL